MATDEETPPTELRRTWPQRILVVAVGVTAVCCFVAAGAIWFAQQRLEERNLVLIDDGSGAANADFAPIDVDGDGASGVEDGNTATSDPEAPVETFPQAEPAARNILITGADNNSCIDPDSPFAGGFGDRQGFGERSDTIMMWRVNPATSQVAVLSFPRDLWVTIDGRSNKDRINTAYTRDEPQRLINTIYNNFGIRTDHFVQIDFCAFKLLVDAVDGVAVPFERPVRDTKTGLNVTTAGCFTFEGDHALAYVRSRSIEQLTDEGTWETDPTSDLGRVSRQQDFIRRVADELLANRFSPEVIRGLFDTTDEYIVTDTGLTVDRVLEFAGVIQRVDPAAITTYQVEATPATIHGNSVLQPRLAGDNMQAVLAVFRGEATLADRPEQVFDVVETTSVETTTPVGGAPEQPATTEPPSTEPAPTTTEPVPFDTLPVVVAEDIVVGIVPDDTVSCN